MVQFKKYIFALAASALALVACDKTQPAEYTPAEPLTGEQVFFPTGISSKFICAIGDESFEIPLSRATKTLDAVDVAIKAEGEGVEEECFDIPASVSFAEGESKAVLTIGLVADNLPLGTFFSLTLTISDESFTTPYGQSSISFTAGIDRPWLTFAKGTLTESPGWWGEEEPNKTLMYQVISDDLWFCKIPECWGYETIKDGGEYEVQDYCFYWDKKTDFLYVCGAWMGFTDGGDKIYVGTLADYYHGHYFSTGKHEIGPYDWNVDPDQWMSIQKNYLGQLYSDDARPHYDGNGGFYLGDSYLCDQSNPDLEGYGYTFQDEPDLFVCDGFVRKNFVIDAEYTGMFVNTEGVAFPIIEFTAEENVASIRYTIISQEDDPVETLPVLVEGEDESVATVKISGTASVKPEIEPGLYTVVALPIGDEDEVVEDKAIAVDFFFPGINAEEREVDATVVAMHFEDAYSAEVAAANNATKKNSFAFGVIGKDIVDGYYICDMTASFDDMTDEEIISILPDNGNQFDADKIAKINSETGFVGGFISRVPDTEYSVYVYLLDKYDAKALYHVTYKTEAYPYGGDLVLGTYYMTSAEGYENEFRLIYSGGDYIYVQDLALEDGDIRYAEYDAANNKLILDGTIKGYEKYGNLFGAGIHYYDALTYYATSTDFDEEADECIPCVFSVDPSSHKLSTLETALYIDLYNDADDEFIETLLEYADGTAVSTTPGAAAASIRTASKDRKAPVAAEVSCAGAKAVLSLSGAKEVKADEGWCKPAMSIRELKTSKLDFVHYLHR